MFWSSGPKVFPEDMTAFDKALHESGIARDPISYSVHKGKPVTSSSDGVAFVGLGQHATGRDISGGTVNQEADDFRRWSIGGVSIGEGMKGTSQRLAVEFGEARKPSVMDCSARGDEHAVDHLAMTDLEDEPDIPPGRVLAETDECDAVRTARDRLPLVH